MDDFSDTKPVGLYEDAIGSKSCNYYLDKFEDFDRVGDGWNPSWNWGAFFGGGGWALYRKMYGWFFAVVLFNTVVALLIRVQNPLAQQVAGIVYLASFFGFAVCANSLYYRKIKSRIASAQRATQDADRVSRRLIAGSGVHAWVLVVMWVIPVIGIVSAISIPAYQDYTTRKAPPITLGENNNIALPNENPYGKFDPSTSRPVEPVAAPAQSTSDQEHFGRIYAAHADADAINNSPNFKSWVAKYPAYQRILAQGTTQEIIDMFTAYKNQR